MDLNTVCRTIERVVNKFAETWVNPCASVWMQSGKQIPGQSLIEGTENSRLVTRDF